MAFVWSAQLGARTGQEQLVCARSARCSTNPSTQNGSALIMMSADGRSAAKRRYLYFLATQCMMQDYRKSLIWQQEFMDMTMPQLPVVDPSFVFDVNNTLEDAIEIRIAGVKKPEAPVPAAATAQASWTDAPAQWAQSAPKKTIIAASTATSSAVPFIPVTPVAAPKPAAAAAKPAETKPPAVKPVEPKAVESKPAAATPAPAKPAATSSKSSIDVGAVVNKFLDDTKRGIRAMEEKIVKPQKLVSISDSDIDSSSSEVDSDSETKGDKKSKSKREKKGFGKSKELDIIMLAKDKKLKSLTSDKLKSLLKANNLSAQGKKPELVERLSRFLLEGQDNE